MKWAFIVLASAVLGAVTGACGFGWFNDGHFQISIVNLLGIAAIVIAANGIWR